MTLQTPQWSLSGEWQGRASLEFSAYRACNAVGFSQVFEKAEELRSRRIRDRKLGAPRRQRLLSGLRPARLRDRFAAERRRLDRNTIQDEESYETTTRPLKRGSSSRLRRWLCDKHKVGSHGYKRFPDRYFYTQLGLVRLRLLTQTRPWANA
jgi:hypothetical protein